MDAGYEGLVQALEHSTIPDRFHSYAKMRIWGNIRNLRLAKQHARSRDATFVQDIADWSESSTVEADERLVWLDAQVQAHTACFPPELLALYRAIRQGVTYGDYAESLGMRRPPMEKHYRRLVRLLREHLIEGTRTCADQAWRIRSRHAYAPTRDAELADAVRDLSAQGLSQNYIRKQLKVRPAVVRRIVRTLPLRAGGQPVAGGV
jgi:hypothetical protein